MKNRAMHPGGIILAVGLGLLTTAPAWGRGPTIGVMGASMMGMGSGMGNHNPCNSPDPTIKNLCKGPSGGLNGGGEPPLSLPPVSVPSFREMSSVDLTGGRTDLPTIVDASGSAANSAANRIRRALAALAARDVRIASARLEAVAR